MTIDIWLGLADSRSSLEALLEESYGDDDNPITAFAASQGERFYDHDFLESHFLDEPTELADAFAVISHGDEVREAALAAATERYTGRPNCIIADFERQFDQPTSILSAGITLSYIGRFEISSDSGPSTVVPEQITLKVLTGVVPYEGAEVDTLTIGSQISFIIGSGPDANLDLGSHVPGIAPRQAEIAYSREKEFWELFDRGGNGLTRYSGDEFDGAKAAPWPGIRFAIGDVEFEWGGPPEE